MKNQIKKIVPIATAFIAFSFFSVAQQASRRMTVNAIQAGTLIIDHGKAQVELSNELLQELKETQNAPVYYVMFTPIGRHANVSLSEKNEKFFVAEATNGKNSTDGLMVDYIVYLRQSFVPADPDLQMRKNLSGLIAK